LAGECRPELYMTREEHDKHCDKQHNAAMEWAHDVVEIGKKDRENLWDEVKELRKIPGRVQTWFIVLLLAGIIVPILVNRYGGNGNDAKFRELAGYIAAVTGQVEEQKDLITKGNEISQANQGKLDKLEKEMRKK
jgi:hypothetical protein